MNEYKDMQDDPDYQAFVEECAKLCHCKPESMCPCDGLLAGGMCDGLDFTEPNDHDYDDEEQQQP